MIRKKTNETVKSIFYYYYKFGKDDLQIDVFMDITSQTHNVLHLKTKETV